MRQLLIEVPSGQGARVLNTAERRRGANLVRLDARGAAGPVELAIVHVPNREVEPLIAELQEIDKLRVTLLPQGVINLQPPQEEAPEQATDIEPRSPLEIFFSGLQSVGSWKGFLAYAAAAGFVVWIGLFTNTVYLLVAAMLIAPFAGPAMNVAMGTARGDAALIRKGISRYFASLAVAILISLALTLVFRQEIATQQMVEISEISAVAALLPLAAGAAGALNLCQSDRNSLVSGAAVGMLIAASLAPPAGVIGMAAAMGEWPMAKSGAFLLLLQLLAINVSGALVFRLYGLTPEGPRFSRGRQWLFPVALGVTLLGLGGVLAWQFSSRPNLQRSSQAQRAAQEVKQAVNESGLARLVEANMRFTRADIPGQNSLLGVLYVQRAEGVDLPAEVIRRRLTETVQQRLADRFNATPLVQVTVLEPPRRTGPNP